MTNKNTSITKVVISQSDDSAPIVAIRGAFSRLRVNADVAEISHGPTVTRFGIRLAKRVSQRTIKTLLRNLAAELAALNARVEYPCRDGLEIAVEVPNKDRAIVTFREVFDTSPPRGASRLLTLPLGKDMTGKPRHIDLTCMPHLLIGGSLHSGKSTFLCTLIAGIIRKASPEEVSLVLISTRRDDLTLFDGIPHLYMPVIGRVPDAVDALNRLLQEMEARYCRFARCGTRNIVTHNKNVPQEDRLPYIVVMIDDLADLMSLAARRVEPRIRRLAQLARATGIHLAITTQKPSADVLTSAIRANIASRIAFTTSSKLDSKRILDTAGAEQLMGRGDMLFQPIDAASPTRIQGCFLSEEEIRQLVTTAKNREFRERGGMLPARSETLESDRGFIFYDEFYEPAVKLVVAKGSATTSLLMRHFRIGYVRAARLMDCLEQNGVVGPFMGAGARKVLMSQQGAEN